MKFFAYATAAILCGSLVLSAHAQSDSYVSGVGDDVNPCTRTAPCKTFAGAISKTSAGGTISAIDPGGYGTVTITKSITLNGGGFLTSMLHSGTTAVIVNAGAADTVVLKDISLNGAGTTVGPIGIRYIAGGRLVVEGGIIQGSTTAINVTPGASTILNLVVRDTVFTGTGSGNAVLVAAATGSTLRAVLRNVTVSNYANGISTSLAGNIDVAKSTFTQISGSGLLAGAGTIMSTSNNFTLNGYALQATAGGIISADRNVISSNAVAMYANGGSIRGNDNTLFDNSTGVSCGSGPVGVFNSTGNNRKANNTGGSLPTCGATGTINLQ
jgi:hypothetical protein